MEQSEPGSGLDPELIAFVHSGVVASVATRDENLRPEFARAWGPSVSADGRSLQLCVAAPEGSRTRANLAANGAVAVGFSAPTHARAVQVKGVIGAMRAPEQGELERVERHLLAFVAEAEQVGVPIGVAGRIFHRSALVMVELAIAEMFEQSPGPTAGRRL